MSISRVLLCLLIFSSVDARAATLSLRDCLELARERNPTLQSASHDSRIAAENAAQAKSGYLPKADFSGGYTVLKDPQAFSSETGSFPAQEADFGFFNFTIDQTLYDFGRTSSQVQGAKAFQQASEFNYLSLEQAIFLESVTAYYQILEAQEVLLAAREEAVQMEDHLRVAQNLYEQGVVTRNDVLQAEVQLAGSRQRLLARQNEVENAWLRLNYLTGRPPQERGDLEQTPALEPIPPAAEPQQAVAGRPELKAQQKLVQASAQEVELSKARFWPELFAQAGVDYVANKFVKEQAIYSATVGLRVNLFDGFATTSRQRQAMEEEARSRGRLRDLQEQAVLEYRTAQNDARVAAQRIDVTRKAIEQGEENLRINKTRYQEQVGTATDVIDAQTLLTRTRSEYYRALFDYEVALARIKRSAGEL